MRGYGKSYMQIEMVCELAKINYDEDFIKYVYNKHLPWFSTEEMRKLKKQYEEERNEKIYNN